MHSLSQNQRIDKLEIIRALKLFTDGPFEIRIIDAEIAGRSGIASGYFDSPEIAADAIAKIHKWAGCYFTVNSIINGLLARRHNRIAIAGKRDSTTSDKDITRRCWLLIDADPVRPAGISSTDAEHDAALEKIREIHDFLAQNGWPEGIIADSGNGGHLTFAIDLPADDGGLVERFLKALADQFDDGAVKIDASVHNAARIWKLPGTMACKGDSMKDRPHRMARIISTPDTPTVVIRDQIEHIAAQAQPKPATPPKPNRAIGSTFDATAFIRQHEPDADGPHPYNGGSKWILNKCAFDDSHSGGSAVIIQHGSGAMDYRCLHNSCASNRWAEYREKREPGYRDRQALPAKLPKLNHAPDYGQNDADTPAGLPVLVFEDAAAMIAANPEMRSYVLHGMLREREIMNFVSASKVGKTWAMLDLALCIVAGRAWLGVFAVTQGEVLYIDAELHPQTISARLKSIASARGIITSEYAGKLQILSLRGRLQTLYELETFFRSITPGRFKAIFIDSLYRLWPAGLDENSNSDVTAVYNFLDRMAELTGAAIICVHHASKGNQSSKFITDVGSGAGAQSRAADTHLILRAHEQDDAAVLESVCRSSAPVAPIGLRWKHPVWFADETLDTDRLREPGQKATGQTWTAATFTDAVLNGSPKPKTLIIAAAKAHGLTLRDAEAWFAQAQVDGLIELQIDPEDNRKKVYVRQGGGNAE